jgi:poly-gamma-glutamate capsule biosynthesis protein CapA/YwtB (metallophosphatase superfamily)
MQQRLARRRFFGAAATLVLAGSASARAWLDRSVRAKQLPPNIVPTLDAPPTQPPAPPPPPTPIPTMPPATSQPVAPYGIGIALSDDVATLLGLDKGALSRQLASALDAVPGASFVPGAANEAVTVTIGTPPPGWQSVVVARIPLVPVVSPRLSVPFLPADQLGALLDGRVANWGTLGALTNPPVELLTLSGLAGQGDARLTAPPERTFATLDDLAGALLGRAGGLAFLPLPALAPRLKPLAIGDMDAASGHGPLDGYPLALTLALAVAPGAPNGTLDAASAFAAAYRADASPSYNILFLGDIIQGRTVHTRMVAHNDFQLPFRAVAPFTTTADLTLADNECDYSDTIPNPVDRDPQTFSFITKTAAVDGLKLAGIRAVSLANNHSMNTGRQGLLDTIGALDARGILHTGAGKDLATAREPVILTVKGVRIAMLGYNGVSANYDGATDRSAGTVPLDMDILTEDMAKAKARADVVIPFFHWSIEYTSVPTAEQVTFAHAAIDLGAAVVIGSHPHWVQATEIYRGKQIIYSLGNFVFDQEWSIETKQGAMAELLLRGDRVVGVRLIPILITDFSTPHIATPAEAAPIFARIWDATDTLAKRS